MQSYTIFVTVLALCAVATWASSPVVSQLPDPKKAADALLLRCSACQSSSRIMKSHLADALIEFQHHPIPDIAARHELMGHAVRGTCQHEQRMIGLLRKADSPKVLPQFQHELLDEYSGDLVKASWITSLWAEVCQEVEARMQPHFLDFALGHDHANWCPVCDESVAPVNDEL